MGVNSRLGRERGYPRTQAALTALATKIYSDAPLDPEGGHMMCTDNIDGRTTDNDHVEGVNDYEDVHGTARVLSEVPSPPPGLSKSRLKAKDLDQTFVDCTPEERARRVAFEAEQCVRAAGVLFKHPSPRGASGSTSVDVGLAEMEEDEPAVDGGDEEDVEEEEVTTTGARAEDGVRQQRSVKSERATVPVRPSDVACAGGGRGGWTDGRPAAADAAARGCSRRLRVLTPWLVDSASTEFFVMLAQWATDHKIDILFHSSDQKIFAKGQAFKDTHPALASLLESEIDIFHTAEINFPKFIFKVRGEGWVEGSKAL